MKNVTEDLTGTMFYLRVLRLAQEPPAWMALGALGTVLAQIAIAAGVPRHAFLSVCSDSYDAVLSKKVEA